MVDAARRAVAAGVAVVAFDLEVDHDSVLQIQQSDRLLDQLVLEQILDLLPFAEGRPDAIRHVALVAGQP